MNDDGRHVSGENHAKKNSCRRTRSSYRFLGNHAPSADGESPRLHRDDSARGGGGGGGGEEGEDAHIQVDRASSLFRLGPERGEMPQNQDQIFGERPVMASRGGESSARFVEGVALRKSGRLREAKAAFREVAGGPRGVFEIVSKIIPGTNF